MDMKWKKIVAEKAPKPYSKYAAKLGIVAAALMAAMALLQLVRFDKFLPELDMQLPGGYGLAIAVGASVVAASIFSIPFLLRMKLSLAARICGGVLALVPPWIWLLITIWSMGNGYVAVQFSTYFPMNTDWWTLIFNAVWLMFNFYVVWQLGLDQSFAKLQRNLKKRSK